MPDPVAERSTFLRMYMSNHPDTLVAYAKWFGKVEEVVKSAEMSYIDCRVCVRCLRVVIRAMLTTMQSMSLTCTLQNGAQKSVIVPIKPPLTGYEEVKPRLLEMKALAQEGLGMVSALLLKISRFQVLCHLRSSDKNPQNFIPVPTPKRALHPFVHPLHCLPLLRPSPSPLNLTTSISTRQHSQISPRPPHLIHILDFTHCPRPRISIHSLLVPQSLHRNLTRCKHLTLSLASKFKFLVVFTAGRVCRSDLAERLPDLDTLPEENSTSPY